MVAIKYAELVYNGLWFSPLKAALDGFVDQTQTFMTGEVKLLLQQGQVRVIGSQSPYSLYSAEYVTFGEDDVYDQKDAQGFINLFTLPLKLSAQVQGQVQLKGQSQMQSQFKGPQQGPAKKLKKSVI